MKPDDMKDEKKDPAKIQALKKKAEWSDVLNQRLEARDKAYREKNNLAPRNLSKEDSQLHQNKALSHGKFFSDTTPSLLTEAGDTRASFDLMNLDAPEQEAEKAATEKKLEEYAGLSEEFRTAIKDLPASVEEEVKRLDKEAKEARERLTQRKQALTNEFKKQQTFYEKQLSDLETKKLELAAEKKQNTDEFKGLQTQISEATQQLTELGQQHQLKLTQFADEEQKAQGTLQGQKKALQPPLDISLIPALYPGIVDLKQVKPDSLKSYFGKNNDRHNQQISFELVDGTKVDIFTQSDTYSEQTDRFIQKTLPSGGISQEILTTAKSQKPLLYQRQGQIKEDRFRTSKTQLAEYAADSNLAELNFVECKAADPTKQEEKEAELIEQCKRLSHQQFILCTPDKYIFINGDNSAEIPKKTLQSNSYLKVFGLSKEEREKLALKYSKKQLEDLETEQKEFTDLLSSKNKKQLQNLGLMVEDKAKEDGLRDSKEELKKKAEERGYAQGQAFTPSIEALKILKVFTDHSKRTSNPALEPKKRTITPDSVTQQVPGTDLQQYKLQKPDAKTASSASTGVDAMGLDIKGSSPSVKERAKQLEAALSRAGKDITSPADIPIAGADLGYHSDDTTDLKSKIVNAFIFPLADISHPDQETDNLYPEGEIEEESAYGLPEASKRIITFYPQGKPKPGEEKPVWSILVDQQRDYTNVRDMDFYFKKHATLIAKHLKWEAKEQTYTTGKLPATNTQPEITYHEAVRSSDDAPLVKYLETKDAEGNPVKFHWVKPEFKAFVEATQAFKQTAQNNSMPDDDSIIYSIPADQRSTQPFQIWEYVETYNRSAMPWTLLERSWYGTDAHGKPILLRMKVPAVELDQLVDKIKDSRTDAEKAHDISPKVIETARIYALHPSQLQAKLSAKSATEEKQQKNLEDQADPDHWMNGFPGESLYESRISTLQSTGYSRNNGNHDKQWLLPDDKIAAKRKEQPPAIFLTKYREVGTFVKETTYDTFPQKPAIQTFEAVDAQGRTIIGGKVDPLFESCFNQSINSAGTVPDTKEVKGETTKSSWEYRPLTITEQGTLVSYTEEVSGNGGIHSTWVAKKLNSRKEEEVYTFALDHPGRRMTLDDLNQYKQVKIDRHSPLALSDAPEKAPRMASVPSRHLVINKPVLGAHSDHLRRSAKLHDALRDYFYSSWFDKLGSNDNSAYKYFITLNTDQKRLALRLLGMGKDLSDKTASGESLNDALNHLFLKRLPERIHELRSRLAALKTQLEKADSKDYQEIERINREMSQLYAEVFDNEVDHTRNAQDQTPKHDWVKAQVLRLDPIFSEVMAQYPNSGFPIPLLRHSSGSNELCNQEIFFHQKQAENARGEADNAEGEEEAKLRRKASNHEIIAKQYEKLRDSSEAYQQLQGNYLKDKFADRLKDAGLTIIKHHPTHPKFFNSFGERLSDQLAGHERHVVTVVNERDSKKTPVKIEVLVQSDGSVILHVRDFDPKDKDRKDPASAETWAAMLNAALKMKIRSDSKLTFVYKSYDWDVAIFGWLTKPEIPDEIKKKAKKAIETLQKNLTTDYKEQKGYFETEAKAKAAMDIALIDHSQITEDRVNPVTIAMIQHFLKNKDDPLKQFSLANHPLDVADGAKEKFREYLKNYYTLEAFKMHKQQVELEIDPAEAKKNMEALQGDAKLNTIYIKKDDPKVPGWAFTREDGSQKSLADWIEERVNEEEVVYHSHHPLTLQYNEKDQEIEVIIPYYPGDDGKNGQVQKLAEKMILNLKKHLEGQGKTVSGVKIAPRIVGPGEKDLAIQKEAGAAAKQFERGINDDFQLEPRLKAATVGDSTPPHRPRWISRAEKLEADASKSKNNDSDFAPPPPLNPEADNDAPPSMPMGLV